jgi:hypothetical protein
MSTRLVSRAAQLSRLLLAIENCRKSDNDDWLATHETRLADIMASAPSGSGIDEGINLSDASTPERLIFNTAYHHMRNGVYDGWTHHTITVRASLLGGFDLKVSGRNRNDIKPYLADLMHDWLSASEPFA